jgi:tetratricopeptide (TPR) repeat protein
MQTTIAGQYGTVMVQILILNRNQRRFAAREWRWNITLREEVYDMTYGNGTRAPSLEAQVLYRQALEMAGTGRYDEAVHVFQNVVTIAPRFTRALMELGKCLDALGRYPEARAAYDRVLEIDPQIEEASARRDSVTRKNGNSQPERQYFTVKTYSIPGNGKGSRDYSWMHGHAAAGGSPRQEAIISPVQAVSGSDNRYHVNAYGSPIR